MITKMNKNYVITGANRGIGLAILKKVIEEGCNAWACMRTISEDTKSLISKMEMESDVWVRPVELDLNSEKSIKTAVNTILSAKTPIDGIVNNAGITGPIKTFSMMSLNEIRDTFDVNFFGPTFFTQRLLKNMMRNKGGSIVNIVSVAALDGEPAQFAYVTSKAAMIGATKKLSSELAPYAIRVNAVAPGMIDTDMGSSIDEKIVERMLLSIPIKRKGEPSEIANTVFFLLSEDSAYISGQIIRVDGGKI